MSDIFHQMGHSFKWNTESLDDDRVGEGLIISPINIPSGQLGKFSNSLISKSIFDPQLYLPHDSKGKIATYDYFPNTISPNWQSFDYEEVAAASAERCFAFQEEKGFKYRLIPARYIKDLTSSYYKLAERSLVEPFIRAWAKSSKAPLLLTIVAKRIQVIDEIQRDELLNWITSMPELMGAYLLFESDHTGKQIKDSTYLCGCLLMIKYLREAGLEVHIGYTNTEALLFSAVGATSVSVGAYENLRRFKPSRFEDVKRKANSPTPRIYISRLLQWIEYGYIGALERLYKDWTSIQDYTPHYVKMFTPAYKWHSNKSDPYKHYFVVMDRQITAMKSSTDPLNLIEIWVREAIDRFADVQSSGIFLDADSDGSHLPHWLNAITLYKKR